MSAELEKDMELALATDASMQEMLDALQAQPLMQRALREAFRVGFSAGALDAIRKATKMMKEKHPSGAV